MGFKAGRRRGSLWADVQRVDGIVRTMSFNLNNKTEREFEHSVSQALYAQKAAFENQIISQVNKETTVESVYCFGKKHRPDICLNNDGVAIEVKFIDGSLDGFKAALGQAMIYRLQYKFAILILVLSVKHRVLYDNLFEDGADAQESGLHDVAVHMATNLNTLTYIVPAFKVKKGQPNLYSVPEIADISE